MKKIIQSACCADKFRIDCVIPRYKKEWHKVVCFRPVYLPDGTNGCRIYYDDNTLEDIHHTLDWVMDDWSHHQLTSVAILQQQSKAWLGNHSRRRVPLVYNHNICLIPVKFRIAHKRGEAVSGYVFLKKVQDIYQRNSQTYIVFNNCTHILPILEQPRTLRDNMQLGWQLLQFFEQEQHHP